MDELNRLADDYEWFLAAVALGVKRGDQTLTLTATLGPRT